MSGIVTIDREALFDLICCAEYYGFNNSMLLSVFGDWLGVITDEEIEAFAQSYLESDYEDLENSDVVVVGVYTQEDVDEARDVLQRFRASYMPRENLPEDAQ